MSIGTYGLSAGGGGPSILGSSHLKKWIKSTNFAGKVLDRYSNFILIVYTTKFYLTPKYIENETVNLMSSISRICSTSRSTLTLMM